MLSRKICIRHRTNARGDFLLHLRRYLFAYLSQTLRGISEDRFSEGSVAFGPGAVREHELAWHGTRGTVFAEASFFEQNRNRISGERFEYGGAGEVR